MQCQLGEQLESKCWKLSIQILKKPLFPRLQSLKSIGGPLTTYVSRFYEEKKRMLLAAEYLAYFLEKK